jgi:uncharacterized membrane protein
METEAGFLIADLKDFHGVNQSIHFTFSLIDVNLCIIGNIQCWFGLRIVLYFNKAIQHCDLYLLRQVLFAIEIHKQITS